jgi:hypothetical protein
LASLLAVNYIFSNYTINILLPFLKAAYYLAGLFIIGYFVSTGKRRKQKQPDSAGALEYIGKGLVLSCFYFYIVSFLKQLNVLTLGIYFLVPLVLLALIIKDNESRAQFLSHVTGFLKRAPFEYLIFLIPLVYASLPSTFYDSLVYHLGLPNFYLQNGGFIAAPQLMYSNMFIFYEISLIPAVFLGDFVPRLFHFLLGTVFILSIVDYGAAVFKIEKRRILLIAIVSLPLTMFLITTVKADLVSAVFIFLGIKKYYDEKPLWSAVFWGFAVGIKVFSGLALVLFLLLMIIKNRRLDFKKHTFMVVIFILVILPLVIKNYLFAGNPFFPFLSQHFPTEFWDSSRYLDVRHEVGTHYRSIIDFFKAPYSFSFELQGAGGMVGPLFLIFLPFLVLYKIPRKYLLFFALALLFAGPFFGEAFRYIYVVFVLLAIFVALSYQKTDHKILKALFVVVVFINGILAFATLETVNSARYIYFDKISIDAYKAHHFSTYKAYSTIANTTEKTARILVAGEGRGYYLKRPYMIASAHDYSILKKYLIATDTPEKFLSSIKADGFDYIVFNLSEFRRLQSYQRLKPEEVKKLFEFFKQIKPLRHEGSLYIYKL